MDQTSHGFQLLSFNVVKCDCNNALPNSTLSISNSLGNKIRSTWKKIKTKMIFRMVLITKKMVTSSKHGMNLWSEFQPCSRVMFQTGKYDFGFGFIIEAPDKVRNKNRFLIMSGKRFQKYNLTR